MVYGRVLVPSNGASQLNLGDDGIKLGGAWRELQVKQEMENRERQRFIGAAAAAVLKAERLGMENEDLTAQAVRLELKLSKAKISDLTSETRADEVESENEALRIMHRNSVVELEVRGQGRLFVAVFAWWMESWPNGGGNLLHQPLIIPCAFNISPNSG